MINCPQCKSPIPREGSRFCNYCGADLRSLWEGLPEKGPIEQGENPSKLAVARPASLRIVERDGSILECKLSGDEVYIGKGAQNDIILSDAAVSSSHALIRIDENGFLLSDLGSRNGTILNDLPLNEPTRLKSGDLIKMGYSILAFQGAESAPDETASDASHAEKNPIQEQLAPREMSDETLSHALVAEGLVPAAVLARLTRQSPSQGRLYRTLLDEELISETDLRDAMSRAYGLALFDPSKAEIDLILANLLGLDLLRRRMVLPLAEAGLVAMANPTDHGTIEDIERLGGRKIPICLATPAEIIEQIDRHLTPRLIGILKNGEKIEALLDQTEVSIGKAPHNRLVLSDPTVSSSHAVILTRDDGESGCSIVDLASSNGTFVNGQRLTNESFPLRHGDRIQLGQVALTFRNPGESVSNRTSKLSPEALEKLKRPLPVPLLVPLPSQTEGPAIGLPEKPTSGASGEDAIAEAVAITPPGADGEEGRIEKRERKRSGRKSNDRMRAALLNSTSRILSTILGTALTVAVAFYVTRPGHQQVSSTPHIGGETKKMLTSLSIRNGWHGFDTGMFGKKIEASGAAGKPDARGLLLVADDSHDEALWMPLDESGKQAGEIVPVPLGVTFQDPEALTYGNAFHYLLTSQSDPEGGARNALVRFDFDPATNRVRGTAEVIPNLREFLLSNVSEIATLGAPSGMAGGLNAEGIAWDPNNERLLLGLRSPLIGNQAVILPLKMADSHGPFRRDNLKVDQPRVIVLSLDGQGIRDITYDPRLKGFLIISGAPETASQSEFALWEWSGQIDSRPTKLLTLDQKMKPEGISSVTIGGHSYIFVAGDGGSYLTLAYDDAQ